MQVHKTNATESNDVH